MIIRMPNQKLGVEMPHSAITLATVSQTVPRPTADTMPAGMPISRAMVMASRASSTVTGNFFSTSVSTGCWVRTDSPRSPCNTPPIQ